MLFPFPFKKILPIALLTLFIYIRESTSTSVEADDNNESTILLPLRLPTSVRPTRYQLHITSRIHQEILGYNGTVTIDLVSNEPTEEIVLHAKLLREFVVSLIDVRNDHEFENLKYSHSNQTDFLRITTPFVLEGGQQYRLKILFKGDIRVQHFGFYRTIYKDEQNNTIPLATTQFEPTSARLAFPCFDEPALKARFVISITHGSNYSALSNMPIEGVPITSPNDDMTTTTFTETPLMPTYLIAFVVSNYDHISELVNGVDHRVFFPPKSKDQGKRALKNSIESVTAIENYFGIKYPLPKLDHIRVDKSYGLAMENWGLITYNKKAFLPTVEGAQRHTTIKMTLVQNHEIAHQWFGNLVSPKWWTYSWLNEGFATYFGYITTDLVHPDWSVMEYFIEKEVDAVLNWPITHAMTHYVEKEADIKSIFDVVSYQKAATFIKMFHHAIGHKTFVKGVALFLTKFQYSVADEEDLFGALQTIVDEEEDNLFKHGVTLRTVMHTWTHNQGIPIVTVIRNYENNTLTIRQRSDSKHLEEMWWIPLSFATASNPNFESTVVDFLMPPQKEVTINLENFSLNISNEDWLIVNKQQTGLYYVIYDNRNLELIAEALNSNHKAIHKFNRALLFRDITNFLDKEIGSIESVFSALQYLKFEQESMPWNTAAELILSLTSKLHGSSCFEMFKSFIRDIVGDIFHRIHQLPETAIDSITKVQVLEVACQVDYIECLNYTKNLAKEYFFNGHEIDSAMREISLCQGLKNVTAAEFQQLVAKLTTVDIKSDEYDDIIYSIRCVESTENLKFFLELIFGENSTQDVMSDLEKMQYLSFLYVSNYASRPVIMDFMRDNYKTLFKNSEVVTITLARISNYVSEECGQKEEFLVLLDDVKEYFQETAKIQDSKIGSRIRERENFKRKHEKSIRAWLNNYQIIQMAKNDIPANSRPSGLTAARYIVAAGFISNLINFV